MRRVVALVGPAVVVVGLLWLWGLWLGRGEVEEQVVERGPGGSETLTLEEDDVIFGQTQELTAAGGAVSSIIGTVFPFPEGVPTKSVYATGSWPTWPNPADLIDEAVAHCFTIHCSYDPDSSRALCIRAYLEYVEGDGPDTDSLEAAIYRAGDGVLLGTTEALVINEGDPAAWYEFTFTGEGPVLVPETEYALVVWGQNPEGMDTTLWGGGLGDYSPPDAIACADELVFDDAVETHHFGVGISAEDTLALDEVMRHGGVQAPCDGRYIPPDSDEHQANPHRWEG